MNRVELIEKKLVADNELSKAAAGRFLDTLIDTIQTTVKEGDTVALIGFGTFKAVKRAARTGKNPRSGEPINIPAGTVPGNSQRVPTSKLSLTPRQRPAK